MRQDVFTLWDEPYWRVLYVFYQLQEHETRLAHRRRAERIDMGLMTNYAFYQPEALKDEMRAVQSAIDEQDRPPVDHTSDVGALRAHGQALAARIACGHVLAPEALVA